MWSYSYGLLRTILNVIKNSKNVDRKYHIVNLINIQLNEFMWVLLNFEIK